MNTPFLNDWLEAEYGFSVQDCSLIRAYTNDVYCVTTPNSTYVLKIYGLNWRTESDLAFEIDLLDHLVGNGVRVANTVAGRSGKRPLHLALDGQTRYALLFEYADGHKPELPFTEDLYYQFGKAGGLLHRAGEKFTTPHQRFQLDTSYLIDEPFAYLTPLLNEADTHFLSHFSDDLKRRIADFASAGLDWGICHGDFTLDNLHVTDDNQIVLYDFDSGGFGWQAIDLEGWAVFAPEYTERWKAYLAGYQSVRTLNPVNVDAAPALYVALEIWGMALDLQKRVYQQGEEAVATFLTERIGQMRTYAEYF